MIPNWLLALLQCPVSHEALTVVSSEILAGLHTDCAAGKVKSKMGFTVSEIPTQGLSNASETWLYPAENGILDLLADDAIRLISK